MKRYKAQHMTEFILVMAMGLLLIMGGLNKYSGEIAYFFKNNDPKASFTPSRIMKYENPKDIVSNITVTIGGSSIDSPVEAALRAGVLSGSNVQTSGITDRLKQIDDIMSNYSMIGTLEPCLNAVVTSFLGAVTAIAEPATEIEAKLAIIKMANLLDPTNVNNLWTNLNNVYTAYTPTNNKENLAKMLTKDLLDIPGKITYSIEPGIYMEVLGIAYNGTLAQELTLINALRALPVAQQQQYNTRISVSQILNYSTLAPQTYNNSVICSNLGGTPPSSCSF